MLLWHAVTRVESNGFVNVSLCVMTKVRRRERRGSGPHCLLDPENPISLREYFPPSCCPCLLSTMQDMEAFGYNTGAGRDRSKNQIISI